MSTALIEEQLRRIIQVLKERLPDPKTGQVTKYTAIWEEEDRQRLADRDFVRRFPDAPGACEEMLDSWRASDERQRDFLTKGAIIDFAAHADMTNYHCSFKYGERHDTSD